MPKFMPPEATGVADATEWLSSRYVGASVAEYIQRLPSRQAETFLADIDDINRLFAEVIQARALAKRVHLNGVSIGVSALIVVSVVGSLWLPGWVAALVSGAVAGLAWLGTSYIKNRIWKREYKAWRQCEDVKKRLLEKYGVVYSENDKRLEAVISLKNKQARLDESLRIDRAARSEIEQIAKLAALDQIDADLVRKLNNQPAVLGGLPTEELIESSEIKKLFDEMSSLGLRNFTIEAILLRYGDELALTPRTLEIAKSRIQRAVSKAGD